jgi:signal transduction histidine kinase/ActR/RegA family two-component response regulator
MLVRASPVHDVWGNVTRWYGSSTEIDETIEAREVLARSREELETLVADRTRDLQETQSRLAHVQRMEALGQLAGGIAHDFNNVLQAVQGGAALIERRSADPEGVRRVARMIFEAAGRGSAVTRRLLGFSRHGDLRAEPIDPASLLNDMQEMLVHTVGAGIEVRVNSAAGLPALLADKGQLETVLVNLAANARDAMGGKGILTLATTLDSVRHVDESKRPVGMKVGCYVCLSVMDDGSGMSPEVLSRVTEPFFTTKPRGEGTGLGLAMAQGFAAQSGGGLEIESAPQRGTTIRLWFPTADETLDTTFRRNLLSAEEKQPARLLVVDDVYLVRQVIAEQLEAAGYVVLTAANGADALTMLDAGESVDLLISDMAMPGMDGLSVIHEAQRRRPKLPAILLTGLAANAIEIAIDGATSGAFSLLRKPVTAELVERVAALLNELVEDQEG